MHVSGAANSIFAIAPGGKIVGRYDKAHLVPYGEYLPMRPLLSAIGLSRLAPGDIDFTPGPGPRTIDLGDCRARSVCSSATRSSSRARWSTSTTARLHLQSVQRRLVRPLGAAAASRPGAASRRRGRPAGHPLDADRHQRGDRRAAATVVKSLPLANPGAIDAVIPPPRCRRRRSRGSATASRCCLAFC